MMSTSFAPEVGTVGWIGWIVGQIGRLDNRCVLGSGYFSGKASRVTQQCETPAKCRTVGASSLENRLEQASF